MAHWAGWQELMLGRIDSVDDVLERLEAVTAEDILSLAQELFKTERLVLAVVGPTRSDTAYRRALRLN